MVTWTIFKNHLLKVGRQTMAVQTLIVIDLLDFIMCEDPHGYKFIEIAFGSGRGHIWRHTTLAGP